MDIKKGTIVKLMNDEFVIIKKDFGETIMTDSNKIYPKNLIKKIYKEYGKNLISKEVKLC